ncbi:hypothetical protein JHK82_016200 [Glycine max]|nr:hypothetical protein JHK85_016601 [Glycine max]KAG5149319.1 hypothetical protein JHK82_016200 [Glycine max]
MRIKELMFKNKVPTKALTIDMKYPPLPTTHIILKKKRVSGLAPSLNMLKRILTHQSNQENVDGYLTCEDEPIAAEAPRLPAHHHGHRL